MRVRAILSISIIMLNLVGNTMNHNLQKEVGFWVNALIKWQPDMSIIGTLDFYQNICKPQWIDVYKKTILELRANRYDGLANTLETCFEVFQKDVTEREKKRLGTDEQQPGYNQVLNAYKIKKPAHSRSGDVLAAFFDIGISKQHLIDVLKKIAELPEMPAWQNGSKAENPAETEQDKTLPTTQKLPKIFGDTITTPMVGLQINWRVCWDKLKNLPKAIHKFLSGRN